MFSMRFGIALVLLSPALAFGQAVDDEDDKVSNDSPARPLQMPPATTEVKEALDDFERFQRRGAWERALKALYTITEDQARRFVDGDSGFIIPVAQKRRQVLTALPPEGQAAYRLFYDAEAAEAVRRRRGAVRAGEPRADLLGLLHHGASATTRPTAWATFTSRWVGSTARPIAGWRSSTTDPTPISRPRRSHSRRRWRSVRAGRRTEFDQVRAELADRYKDDEATIGGTTAAPAELAAPRCSKTIRPPRLRPNHPA